MGKKAPKPPNLKPITDAQLKIADQMNTVALEQLGLSKEQFAYFKEQGAAELAFAREQAAKQLELQDRAIATGEAGQRTQEELADAQKRLMDQAYDYSLEDRERYRDTAIPLQDRIIDEANRWDSPERQAQLAAEAQADVQRQADAQQRNVDSRLAGMGIDPSQMRAGTIANQMGLQTAALGAMQGNNARQQVQQQAIALRGQAANMVAGLPSQGAQQQGISSGAGGAASNTAAQGSNQAQAGYGTAAGIGNNAVNMRTGALGTMGSLTGTPMQWAGQSNQARGLQSNSVMNAGNIMNSGYQNQLDRFNAQAQATQGMVSSLGALAGGVAGFADGGVTYMPDGAEVEEAVPSRTRRVLQAVSDTVEAMPEVDYGPRQRRDGTEIEQHFYADGRRPRSALPARQSVDRVPAMLSEEEFVIPRDVVRALGTRHFEKLVEKYHRIGS